MKKEDVLIRPLRSDDSISCLTELLHSAYAPLAQMGLRYMASHQSDAITHQRLQRGFALVAELEGNLIGTATLYSPNPESRCLWYRQAGVYSFGQFGVHPEFQRYGVGRQLYERIEQEAQKRGASELALDTAEEALHLRQWYERLGFCFIEYVSWAETNYRSVVLSKQLQPFAHNAHQRQRISGCEVKL